MKLRSNAFSPKLAALLLVVTLTPSLTASKPKNEGQLVDSGSFGIFVNGRRIGTETFKIQQMSDGSAVKSDLKVDDGRVQAVQSSELQMTTAGDLKSYTWTATAPEHAEATVAPENQFLVEHISGAGASPNNKPFDQPFVLPPSTPILDDYFFTHREVLLWKYLASGCKPNSGQTECKLTKSQYGVLIPRQRTSVPVSVEYIGKETIEVHGKKEELNRFNLSSEDGTWALWLDDSYHLIRVLITADNTEVVRD